MSFERIEKTSLWLNSLAANGGDDANNKGKLRVALKTFRANTEKLVSKIAGDFPNLTQHDISHLDALWETASLIAGNKYPLNPLEAFVFGGAVLLHDAALCFEAYENGIDGLRNTTEWKDIYASLCDDKKDGADIEKEADFIAIRHLHSKQAEELVEKSWEDPDTKTPIFLLEDSSLRKHYGQIIGQVASSHHWNIEEVGSKLPTQLNAISGFPKEWRINPVKIACLLRCADAAHIDNDRAPDFLHALLKRSGVSFAHWQAQNRLTPIDIEQAGGEGNTAIFTSTRYFNEHETEAWWVAYDAICLVDKEIRSCNDLLDNFEQFQVKRIAGVESPSNMQKHITVSGWAPISAELHVSNIEKLVENLGGEKLYGAHEDLFGVAIRELIQNSRDAVVARRSFEEEFVGEIVVKIISEADGHSVIIEDNGVGMAKRVMTGPLLDFGTSFWTSSLVQSEFPGLRSSKFKSVGQFGIGFYSIFMIADFVSVSSRRWKDGLSDVNQLIFKNGLTFRPLLKQGAPTDFSTSISTQIKLSLKPNILSKDLKTEIKINVMHWNNFQVELEDYLSAMCAGLDVDVCLQINSGTKNKIHTSIKSRDFSQQKMLEKVSFSKYQTQLDVPQYIQDNVNRLRIIEENGQILGIAAISTDSNSGHKLLSMRTIGGLTIAVGGRNGEFIGFMECLPKSAKRDSDQFAASQETLKKWAVEQMEILLGLPLNYVSRYVVASNLCSFGIDPTQIASLLVSVDNEQKFLNFEELADIAEHTPIAIIKSSFASDHADTHNSIQFISNIALIKPIAHGNFLSLKMDGDIPENNNSIIDCLHRMLVKKGKTPKWSVRANIGFDKFGYSLSLLVVSIQ